MKLQLPTLVFTFEDHGCNPYCTSVLVLAPLAVALPYPPSVLSSTPEHFPRVASISEPPGNVRELLRFSGDGQAPLPDLRVRDLSSRRSLDGVELSSSLFAFEVRCIRGTSLTLRKKTLSWIATHAPDAHCSRTPLVSSMSSVMYSSSYLCPSCLPPCLLLPHLHKRPRGEPWRPRGGRVSSGLGQAFSKSPSAYRWS